MENNIKSEKERIKEAIRDQKKWIDNCGYTDGEMGSLRRELDLSALSNLEKRLAKMTEDQE